MHGRDVCGTSGALCIVNEIFICMSEVYKTSKHKQIKLYSLSRFFLSTMSRHMELGIKIREERDAGGI